MTLKHCSLWPTQICIVTGKWWRETEKSLHYSISHVHFVLTVKSRHPLQKCAALLLDVTWCVWPLDKSAHDFTVPVWSRIQLHLGWRHVMKLVPGELANDITVCKFYAAPLVCDVTHPNTQRGWPDLSRGQLHHVTSSPVQGKWRSCPSNTGQTILICNHFQTFHLCLFSVVGFHEWKPTETPLWKT